MPKMRNNSELREAAGKKPMILQIRTESMEIDLLYSEEQTSDWNPQRAGRRG